jgi:hypothetical protein
MARMFGVTVGEVYDTADVERENFQNTLQISDKLIATWQGELEGVYHNNKITAE